MSGPLLWLVFAALLAATITAAELTSRVLCADHPNVHGRVFRRLLVVVTVCAVGAFRSPDGVLVAAGVIAAQWWALAPVLVEPPALRWRDRVRTTNGERR